MEQINHQLNLFDGLEFSYYIESLLERKESASIEFKSAKGGFPKNFWETYSAFANTHGGIIVLGVKEDKDELVIEGLSEGQIRHYQKFFWDTINNKEYTNLNLLRNDDVKEGFYCGKKLLVFYIPQADRSQRPIHLTINPFEHTFKRNHEGDYKCTNAEVKRMIADADISEPRDSKILKGFTIEDIDLDSIRQYRQLFSISKPNHTWLGLDDIELLKKLGGYRKDRTTNEEGYTLAGLLMFGKMNAITDPHCAPNYFPDFRENLSADPDIRWTDRICYDGEWEANLFQFYRRVYNKLTKAVPSPFKISKGIRIDDSPTHIALREAFVNALVHCDYEAEGGIVIEQLKDKLIFSNPGTLMISISQYYQGGESVCRNPHLQQMFMLIGSAEKAGSGVNKILKGWKEARWKDPYIEDFTHPDKVKLTSAYG